MTNPRAPRRSSSGRAARSDGATAPSSYRAMAAGDRIWFNPPNSDELISPFSDPRGVVIQAAQAFSVSLRSFCVADDLDGFFRGDNDILVTSRAALGAKPPVDRVHYFQEELPVGETQRSLLAESMFVCDDYNGVDSLWLELQVVEIDTSDNERSALVAAFRNLAVAAGAIFPAILPYTALGAGLLSSLNKLWSAIEKDTQVIRSPLRLEPSDRFGAKLQPGIYVVFQTPVKGEDFRMKPGFILETPDGYAPRQSYATYSVEAVKALSPDFVVSDKVATLLTQLRDSSRASGVASSFDFLRDTLSNYSNFEQLRRYKDLSG